MKILKSLSLLCLLVGSQSFAATNETTIVAGSAKVNSTCTVSVLPIDFGVINSNSQNLQSTILSATCTKGTTFNISLSEGQSNDFNNRFMTLSNNSDSLRYNIYLDAFYLNIFGDGNNGTIVLSDVGTGNEQNYTIYGKIPTGQYVSPGNYSDLITATLFY